MSLELDPGSVIEERELWTLAVNRNQNLLGKTMIALKRPCAAVVDLREDEWLLLRKEIHRLTGALESLFEPDQFNYAFLMNVDAQVHLHVIPRYATTRSWRGHEFRDLHWGKSFGTEQRPLTNDQMIELSADIRSALPDG